MNDRRRLRIVALVALAVLVILAALGGLVTIVNLVESPPATPRTWYVSRRGDNADGQTWATAWNELNTIDWRAIKPGDRIILDGGAIPCPSPFNASSSSPYDFPFPKPGQAGSCGMLYNTTLSIGKSGTEAAPILIELSREEGHDGTAVIFGGRTSSLPDCTQPTYSPTTSGNQLTSGIATGENSYVTVDGMKRSGIVIYGAQSGVSIDSTGASFLTFQNLEIFDNGIFAHGSRGWHSDDPGIWMRGHDLVFSRLLVHDNGQDAIQSNSLNGTSQYNVTVTDSWLYFSRENPFQPGWGFNTGNNQPCTHPDGIQTWDGADNHNLTVQNTIVGPYLGQGIYPADAGTGAKWDYVTLSNVLFFNPWYDTINADRNPTIGWRIFNVTSYKWGAAPDGITGAHLDGIRGTGHTLENSIFVNAVSDTGLTGFSASGNLYFDTSPVPGGTATDPQFVRVLATGTPHWSDFQRVDLTPQCAVCSGKGASLHTLQDLLDRIDNLNAEDHPLPSERG
ncbi:MAG TPA: hypothetical protein VFZ25_07140 [Chloroflexota bacterium]|nr:hypothetical protein [Chloroflexota bacterium]